MVSDKESIERLVQICQEKDLEHVVISPGSRNAPLVISFDSNPSFTCFNIPDERVAGFFALGLSLWSGKPSILCCTSGSALLNYAPAIAEAYYQKIPLLILSADRPTEWIDQRAGQTVRQFKAFDNYIKKSFQAFEEASHPDQIWYNDRVICEAIDITRISPKGPVHINVPLREPLYGTMRNFMHSPKVVNTLIPENSLDETQWKFVKEQWRQAEKVMILCGQGTYEAGLTDLINHVLIERQAVVLTECTSNIGCPGPIQCIDRTIESIDDNSLEAYTPDLLITMGAAVVSKKIRYLLRKMKIAQHWHVDISDYYMDTYKALTLNVPLDATYLLQGLKDEQTSSRDEGFTNRWEQLQIEGKRRHDRFVEDIPWSDFKVFDLLMGAIPTRSTLFLANSTPIRYAQLFDQRTDLEFHANRGVSGIDGCTSTAAGYAVYNEKMTTLVTGDIAFFYDSNALWHHHLSGNLRIVVINNQGGGIFRFIPGPSDTAQLDRHFEAFHDTSARGLCKSYDVEYHRAENVTELQQCLSGFFSPDKSRPALLEILTPRTVNDKVLKAYFKMLKD